LLGFTDGLNGQFLIAHRFKLHATGLFKSGSQSLFHYRNKVPQFSSNLGKREGDGKPAKGVISGTEFWR
jgi:hypothetical protein